MSIRAILEAKDSPLEAIRGLLRGLLEKGVVEALLVPLEAPSGHSVMPALVREPARLERANPLAPVMAVNGATLVSALTVRPPGGKIGAVLRSCEVRALIELVKLKQATLDNLLVMGIDCLGTYEVADYDQMAQDSPLEELLAGARSGLLAPREGYRFRPACRICERPIPHYEGMLIGLIGLGEGQILLEVEEGLAEILELEEGEVAGREETVSRLIEERAKERDEAFARFWGEVIDMPSLLAQFSTCIRCHNCMVACPLCYCKECLFRTATMAHEPDTYLRWAQRKGAIQMPTDTLLFHLTRLNHMVTSCAGCGMCESACPSHIPLTTIFRAVGQEVQALFDYQPGRSLEDELPLATFREEEFQQV